jgi:squalene-hopene/tetraprenyl-beta-curcumene cyclase
MFHRFFFICLALILTALFVPSSTAQAAAPDPTAQAKQVCDKSVAWLKTQQQPDGLWTKSPREPIALSAMVLKALIQDTNTGPADPAVKKCFAKLLTYQKPDGSIDSSAQLSNYNTAIIVSALAATKDAAYKDNIDKAVGYLKSVQFSDSITGIDGKKLDSTSPLFGGWAYGGAAPNAKPDLSNTGIVLDALKDAGLPSTDPTYQRALTFVSRLQNNSETNSLKWAGTDGGFVYSMDASGKAGSAAGEYTDASGKVIPRSYGSMTYAGLKSMIYAGLTRDDPRVKAAWQWVPANWSLDENPGMRDANPANAKDGLFYYYDTLARALSVYGQTTVTSGAKRLDWRIEIIAKLAAQQKPDGSFVGNNKFMEDNPVLATAFAVLAVQDAVRDLHDRP